MHVKLINDEMVWSDQDTFFNDLLSDIDGDWSIEFADLDNIGYDLDIQNTSLILHNYGLPTDQALKSPYFGVQIRLSLIEALRMIRHVEWLNGRLERYDPQAILQIGRICVADAATYSIAMAWDFKMSGEDSMWKNILCSDLSDMALSFSNALDTYLTSGMNDGLAKQKSMASSFHKWFSNDDRLRDCDHDTLDLIDQMVQEDVEFSSKKLNRKHVEFLTFLAGDHVSYLDLFLQEDVVYSPYYIGINDIINETHLIQISKDMNKTRIGGLIFKDSGLASRFTFCE